MEFSPPSAHTMNTQEAQKQTAGPSDVREQEIVPKCSQKLAVVIQDFPRADPSPFFLQSAYLVPGVVLAFAFTCLWTLNVFYP